MTNKMTYTKALEIAISAVTDEEAMEKLVALKAQMEKKASTPKKPTKAQQENAEVKAKLIEIVTSDGVRAGDVANVLGISGQKASALLNQLVKDGYIRKVEGEKRVTLFATLENTETIGE